MEYEDKILLEKDICRRIGPNCDLLVKWGDLEYSILGIAYGRLILVRPLMSITAGSPLVEEVKPYLRSPEKLSEKEMTYWHKLQRDLKLGGNIDLMIDFYTHHNIDYLGLLPKGLAIEAPDDMYSHLQYAEYLQ